MHLHILKYITINLMNLFVNFFLIDFRLKGHSYPFVHCIDLELIGSGGCVVCRGLWDVKGDFVLYSSMCCGVWFISCGLTASVYSTVMALNSDWDSAVLSLKQPE